MDFIFWGIEIDDVIECVFEIKDWILKEWDVIEFWFVLELDLSYVWCCIGLNICFDFRFWIKEVLEIFVCSCDSMGIGGGCLLL